ncbi:MAG: calcium/sodium antiporter [Pseudomonadota bacterium]
MMWLLILAGFILLFAGGEALVRGSVGVARRVGMSELVIGLTLVGFGTSLPELVTSLQALSTGAVGLSVGNVIGSNVANILLVIGAAALVRAITTNPRALARDGLFMFAVTVLFALIVWYDLFTRWTGIALTVLLVAYLIVSVILDRRANSAAGTMHQGEAEEFESDDPIWLSILLTLGGIAGVIFGARFLVDGGSQAARLFGVSETVIGISIVAIGTSLPELVTSVMAARKGKADVALGNVLGSNVFNILGILGISAIVFPFSVRGGGSVNASGDAAIPLEVSAMQFDGAMGLVTWTDMGALFLSLFLLFLFAFTGRRLARWEGGILLAAYLLYLGLRFDLVPTF